MAYMFDLRSGNQSQTKFAVFESNNVEVPSSEEVLMKLDKAVEARIKNVAPKKQKGASSLEYIMLAAVIIGIVAVVFNSDLGTELQAFVKDLFGIVTTPPADPE